MNKIRCLVVDDHVLLRQGVTRLLEGESDCQLTRYVYVLMVRTVPDVDTI